MSLHAGQRLSVYEVLGPLGTGGMGEVVRARDTRLDREVALKVLPEHLADDELALRRFEREARTLASLNHPNVGGIHDIDQVGDVCFLVLELVPGVDLARRCAEGPLAMAQALDVARQVAEGLAAAHRSGVVHRDLKPANVVLTPDGRAKLLDFGLAKRVELSTDQRSRSGTDADRPLTGEGVLIGTVDYMSPEQSRGREVDERSDLWAFGCLLFELLAGTRIFPATTVPEKLAAIAADEPDWDALPRATPPSVAQLLRRCLHKDPEQRRLTLEEAAAELRAACEVRATAPPEEGPSIAVLPFVNHGAEAEDEYFSDGVTDEIQLALSGIPGLRVAARSSAYTFKGRPVDVAKVGEQLGVTRVLEGSVRRAGDRVRIAVRLIDTQGGFEQWSERFDCKLHNLFDLQDRLAQRVAAALRVELRATPDPRRRSRRSTDLLAYDRYLQGRFFFQQRGSDLERALAAFEAALEVDPELASAHAGLAQTRGLLSYYGSRPPRELMPQARQAAERALELEPELAEAHTALGWVQLMYDWDDGAAQRSFLEALRLDPRADQARLWYGAYSLALFAGSHDEGIELCREATRIDPLSGSAHVQLAVAQNFSRRPADALATLEPQVEAHSSSYLMWFQRGLAHSNLGRHAEARDDLQRALALSSVQAWAKALLAATHHRLGEHDEAQQLHDELLAASAEHYLSAFCLALPTAAEGDAQRALAHLEVSAQERDGLLRAVPAFGIFDELREEPRYGELLRRCHLA